MRPSRAIAARELAAIDSAGLRRSLRAGDADGAHIILGRRRLLNLSSNDYLGLRARSRARAPQAASSSRLLSGNSTAYAELEARLASHALQEAALVFPTGYMANIGAIAALARRGDVILSDSLCHASIIDACRLSRARTIVYAHDDACDLDSKLRVRARNVFVVTEGVFSMDGDVPDLRALAGAAESRGAVTILDDAHGDFAIGRRGGGAAELRRVQRRMCVRTGSLSKALGAFGGYAAADAETADLLANRARTLMYTSAIPPALVLDALARIRAPMAAARRRLARNTAVLHGRLAEFGFGRRRGGTHIAPVIVGSERTAARIAADVFDAGVFAQAIRYPTVARGEARLRVSVTARMSRAQILGALDVIEAACRRRGAL